MKHYRLIWNNHWPAPYESAWSYLGRLLAINGMLPRQLYPLICNDAHSHIKSDTLDYNISDWIDFNKLAALLNVTPLRLRHGFLDQLGFPVTSAMSPRHGIRHCPKCLKAGYHSVFFELSLINYCPWHGAELMSGCRPCATTVRYSGFAATEVDTDSDDNNAFTDYIIGTPCGHETYDTRDIHSFDVGDLPVKDVLRKSNSFLLWWGAINKDRSIPQGTRGALIGRSNDAYSQKHHEFNDKFLFIIEKYVGPCPWKISARSVPTDFMKWENSDPVISSLPDGARTSDKIAIATYKSIRRHLTKKYVKSHRYCYNQLTHISDHESMCLHKGVACTVSVSFVTWRMRIETIDKPRTITMHHANSDEFRLMLFPDWSNSQNRSLTEMAHNWYGMFFNIWGVIEDNNHIHKSLRIVRNYLDRAYNYNLNYNGFYYPVLDYVGSLHEKIQWTLLPVRRYLVERSRRRCDERRKKNLPMINSHVCDEMLQWSWRNDEFYKDVRQRHLFYLIRDDEIPVKYRADYLVL